ncbi:MAG TPA: hypothetical protein VGK74_00925 [Symbiobacteriaceae bacterium]
MLPLKIALGRIFEALYQFIDLGGFCPALFRDEKRSFFKTICESWVFGWMIDIVK